MLDLGTAVRLEGVADDGVVGSEKFLGHSVAKALGEGGGAFHVGEEDSCESGRVAARSAVRPASFRLLLEKEIQDGLADLKKGLWPGSVPIAFDGNETRVRDGAGDLASLLEGYGEVASCVHNQGGRPHHSKEVRDVNLSVRLDHGGGVYGSGGL